MFLTEQFAMNVIAGASGQVGSAIVAHLNQKGLPVKGLVRDEKKAVKTRETGAFAGKNDAQSIHNRLLIIYTFVC